MYEVVTETAGILGEALDAAGVASDEVTVSVAVHRGPQGAVIARMGLLPLTVEQVADVVAHLEVIEPLSTWTKHAEGGLWRWDRVVYLDPLHYDAEMVPVQIRLTVPAEFVIRVHPGRSRGWVA